MKKILYVIDIPSAAVLINDLHYRPDFIGAVLSEISAHDLIVMVNMHDEMLGNDILNSIIEHKLVKTKVSGAEKLLQFLGKSDEDYQITLVGCYHNCCVYHTCKELLDTTEYQITVDANLCDHFHESDHSEKNHNLECFKHWAKLCKNPRLTYIHKSYPRNTPHPWKNPNEY